MATILTKKSDSSSAVPLAGDLTNSTGGAELAVNTADKRLFTKTSGGTVVEVGTNPSTIDINAGTIDGTAIGASSASTGAFTTLAASSTVTLSGGTANGVLYLNGSKVATSGSALVFDGTTLGVSSGSSSTPALKLYGAAVSQGQLQFSSTSGYAIQGGPDYTGLVYNVGSASYQHIFQINSSEQMRLTSTGLGIGTSSPTNKLEVATTTTNTGITIYNNNGSGGLNARLGFKSLNGYDASSVLAAVTAVPNASSNTATALTFATSGDNSVASAGLTERMRIDSSGNLLVGTTSGSAKVNFTASTQTNLNLDTSGVAWAVLNNHTNGGAQFFSDFRYNGTEIGSITGNNTATAYNTSSDYRLKENIAPMTGALDKVAALKPCTYTWKIDGSAGEGFIAHELAEVVPQCVTGEKDAVDADGKPQYQGVDTSFLVATLTAAIQEQQAIIESLKSRLDAAGL